MKNITHPDKQRHWTVQTRLEQFGSAVQTRLKPHFQKTEVGFPPAAISLLAFKDAQELQLYAKSSKSQQWHWIRNYPIQANSGIAGPKLRDGDKQIPEGIYNPSCASY